MASPYLTPGVYIKELTTQPLSAVRNSRTIPVFAGFTKLHGTHFDVGDNVPPVLISSYQEYVSLFGSPNPESFSVQVQDTEGQSGLNRSVVVSRDPQGDAARYIFAYAIQMYFENGGGPCFVVSLGPAYTPNPYTFSNYWYNYFRQVLPKMESASLIVLPEAVNLTADLGTLYSSILNICNTSSDKFFLMDVVQKSGNNNISPSMASLNDFRSLALGSAVKHGAAYFPYLKTSLRYVYDPATITVTHTVGGAAGPLNNLKLSAIKQTENVLYYDIIGKVEAIPMYLPPSSAVAGQMVSNDRDRGIWKAPANIALNAVVSPSQFPTISEQEQFNVDPQKGLSVNLIRTFPGRGNLIYGARTLDGNSPEWRYISVRRLFSMVEGALKRGSEWAVFEPNDANTWLKLQVMIENFLTGLWRDGALQGATAKQAFFVKVGLGSTMTKQDILDGMLKIEVGMAAVRPAEFIVLRVSQTVQQP